MATFGNFTPQDLCPYPTVNASTEGEGVEVSAVCGSAEGDSRFHNCFTYTTLIVFCSIHIHNIPLTFVTRTVVMLPPFSLLSALQFSLSKTS